MRKTLVNQLSERIAALKAMGLSRHAPLFENSASFRQTPFAHAQGRSYLSFISNDILGLADDKTWREEVASCFSTYSPSGKASRLAGGYCEINREAESAWASYFGNEECLFLPSGYQANLACMSALLSSDTDAFVDRRVHASMAWPLALFNARIHAYPHADLSRLEKRLAKLPLESTQPIVVAESVHSMDGLITDPIMLEHIKKKHDFFLIADEAHAFGLLGPHGQGLYGGIADVRTGTLGKAFGFFGAFILMPKSLKEIMEHLASAIIHSTILPAAHSAVIMRLLHYLPDLESRRSKALGNAELFRQYLQRAGLPYTGQAHIVAIPVRGEKKCLEAAGYLRANKVLALAARYPTVPPGHSMLRFVFNTAHDEQHIKSTVGLLEQFFSRHHLLFKTEHIENIKE